MFGGMGGFAGGIAATAVVQQIQTFLDSASKLGQALSPLVQDVTAVTTALGLQGSVQEAQLKYQKDLGTEFFYSVSPKMFSVSGEKDVVRPKVVKMYHDISRNGQLKFVSNGTDESWDEIEDAIVQFRDHGIEYPIWIMPVGALEETQKDNAKEIVEQTIDRGYNVSARVHCYIFGNQIGT